HQARGFQRDRLPKLVIRHAEWCAATKPMQVGAGHAFIIADRSKAQQYAWHGQVSMKTPLVLLIAFSMCLTGCGRTGHEEPLVACNNDFGFDVYTKIRNRPGNLVFSPHSVLTALAMLYAGAGGDTAKEIAAVARFPHASSELHFRSSLWPFKNQPGALHYSVLDAN